MKQSHFFTVEEFIARKQFFPYKDTITSHSKFQISQIIQKFDKNYLTNLKVDMVINLLKYNVDGDWVYRLIESEKYKHDGFSMESCKLRYGVAGETIYHERLKKVISKKENYTLEEWNLLCKRKKSNLGLKGYIKKFGEIKGSKRWNEYLRKWKIGIEKKKIEGWKSGGTLENLQLLYGIDGGYNRWKNKIIRHKKSLSLDGYIKKYGKIKGPKKWEITCKNRSITSLKAFISRYGVETGTCRFNSFCDQLSYKASLSYYIEKYGSILGVEKYKERIIRCTENKFNGYSKISQELFWEIYDKLCNELKTECHFHELDHEVYFFVNESWAKMIYVDFKCKNAIIEFDGDYWHTLPYHLNRDPLKNKYLKQRKYNLLRIRELDYINNKQETIDKCIKFINENYEKS